MATIAERLIKLGVKLAPWLPWVIANGLTTYRQAYNNHAEFKASVDSDAIADELVQSLDSPIAFPD